MTVGFTSCNKDDDPIVSGAFDGVITAQVENGNIYNNLVKRVTAGVLGYEDYNVIVLASGPYANGGFTLTLPQTVDTNHLFLFLEDLNEDLVSISDKNVQIMVVGGYSGFAAFSSSTGDITINDYVGNISAYKVDSTGNPRAESGTGTYSMATIEFIYADRDVTITATDTYTDGEYDDHPKTFSISMFMFLKKGWNRVYISESYKYVNGENREEEVLFTTTPISGLKWYCEIYDPFGSPAKQAKSAREGGHKRFGRLGR